ncbi:hypothetical protein C8F04DRAFT_1187008 [Mycena alexandri]|uniref:Uncharacterized protein n=1 Tax=Mycena alexandri TaxID=1745969 RepID=A0AAD6SLM1_9AGAR|nr:hypothetical protein C8F04DRAFT_1187008 [Mycena alexandri]
MFLWSVVWKRGRRERNEWVVKTTIHDTITSSCDCVPPGAKTSPTLRWIGYVNIATFGTFRRAAIYMVDMHKAARGDDHYYGGDEEDDDDVEAGGGEEEDFGTLEVLQRADVYCNDDQL